MKYIGYALLLFIAIAAYSFKPHEKNNGIVPSKNIISKDITVGDFSKLDVTSMLAVKFTQSSEAPKIVVNGPDNLIERLEFVNTDGKLSIGYKKGTRISYKNNFANNKVVVEITAPAPTEIDLSGASSFNAESLNVDEISIDNSGASVFKVNQIDANKADIELSGASNATLTNAQIAVGQFDISGASTMKVNNYSGDNSRIEVSGASTINLIGTVDTLNLNVSGASAAKLADLQAKTGRAFVTGASTVKTNIEKLEKIVSNGSSNFVNKK